jgi:hypothetical protein
MAILAHLNAFYGDFAGAVEGDFCDHVRDFSLFRKLMSELAIVECERLGHPHSSMVTPRYVSFASR